MTGILATGAPTVTPSIIGPGPGSATAVSRSSIWPEGTSRCRSRRPTESPFATRAGDMTGFSFKLWEMQQFSCFRGSQPILATHPWLIGTCYFGSWALDHPLSETQKQNVINSEFIWISHGHPDHLHQDFCASYAEVNIFSYLIIIAKTFIRIFAMRDSMSPLCRIKLGSVGNELRIMSIDNFNQDAILVIEAGYLLLINQNDSPIER